MKTRSESHRCRLLRGLLVQPHIRIMELAEKSRVSRSWLRSIEQLYFSSSSTSDGKTYLVDLAISCQWDISTRCRLVAEISVTKNDFPLPD